MIPIKSPVRRIVALIHLAQLQQATRQPLDMLVAQYNGQVALPK